MRHLDLFSGIGGFALAASWVWPDHEVVAFCDIEPYATKVLNRHWPDVPVINDVRNINKDTIDGPIHLITGGFPCQPFSQAGKRKGTNDDRYLWPEMLRIITEFRPRFVLGENVSGIYTISEGVVFEQVCSDLESRGYEVWPLRIPASAVNAPHRRDRWWFAAYLADPSDVRGDLRLARHGALDRRDVLQDQQHGPDPIRSRDDQRDLGAPAVDPYDHGLRSVGVDREHGEQPSERREYALYDAAKDDHTADWQRHWLEAAAEFCRVDDGLSDRMDTGDRKDRLKALGNAIVPQVAAQIMRAMKEAHEMAAG